MNFSFQFLDTTANPSVNTIYGTILSIPWTSELWLISLIGFHFLTTMCVIAFRKYTNLLLFVHNLVGTVWCSHWINEFAANNWNLFATEQYFDSYGYFISCIWNVPVILNSLLIVLLLVLQINSLIIQSKRFQIANEKRLKTD
ncbi:hypothetical protein Smp_104000.1 [Schistosoma mansoni]|uniref:hypothetical protein n=1 Tax=Schistosoma mansoni TaxID=6183 RepID=UPI0001A628FA|nr:hypothetical protein Smp_104000.1 [Schistosoma mansoni]|eukprot:XP_018649386.1 hypothetical protein Smp_104000.1 [Schistosoma mansoni]